MTSSRTRRLVVAATALGGILAGGSLDRSAVQLPAWRRVGPVPWAAYSREADLGNGLVWYPLLGLGAPLLSIAAALAVRADRGAPRSGAAPAYAAAMLSVGHMLTTTRAAPTMLGVRRLGDDTDSLRGALDHFERWQVVRSALQALTFAANLWSLVAISRE